MPTIKIGVWEQIQRYVLVQAPETQFFRISDQNVE